MLIWNAAWRHSARPHSSHESVAISVNLLINDRCSISFLSCVSSFLFNFQFCRTSDLTKGYNSFAITQHGLPARLLILIHLPTTKVVANNDKTQKRTWTFDIVYFNRMRRVLYSVCVTSVDEDTRAVSAGSRKGFKRRTVFELKYTLIRARKNKRLNVENLADKWFTDRASARLVTRWCQGF